MTAGLNVSATCATPRRAMTFRGATRVSESLRLNKHRLREIIEREACATAGPRRDCSEYGALRGEIHERTHTHKQTIGSTAGSRSTLPVKHIWRRCSLDDSNCSAMLSQSCRENLSCVLEKCIGRRTRTSLPYINGAINHRFEYPSKTA